MSLVEANESNSLQLTQNEIASNFISLANGISFMNENGKRQFENENVERIDDPSDTSLIANNNGNQNGKKQKRFKKIIEMRKAKIKQPKAVIYQENIHPAQTLNEVHPNLVFTFEVDTSILSKVKFICNVKFNLADGKEVAFTGDALSKKDAKKKCCHKVLMSLYGDTYKPPQEVIDSYNKNIDEVVPAVSSTNLNKNSLNEIKKRIAKICNKKSLEAKTAAQLLHELSKEIADTGKCVSETGPIPEQKFTFQFTNALARHSDSNMLVAYGFGKNKKDAKNHAAKQALKQFLDCDIDFILSSNQMMT